MMTIGLKNIIIIIIIIIIICNSYTAPKTQHCILWALNNSKNKYKNIISEIVQYFGDIRILKQGD